jgi:hypothetical protein
MKKFGNMTVALSLMAILSACGSQSSRDQVSFNASNNTTPGTITGGNTQGLPLAPESDHKLTGINGSIPQSEASNVQTSMLLKVKVTAGSAAYNTVNPNYINPYGCFRVKVTALIGNSVVTRTTDILRVDGVGQNSKCPNAPTSQIVDFSQYMTGYSAPIVVRFSNAEYDNCWNSTSYYTNGAFYGGNYYGCDMKPLYQSHAATFKATIQTDGTYME